MGNAELTLTRWSRRALGAGIAATFLAACSSSGVQQPLSPAAPAAQSEQSAAKGAIPDPLLHSLASMTPNGRVPRRHPDHSRSWMAKDVKNTRLVYISDGVTGDVSVFSYRQGVLKGTLTGFTEPVGMCSDSSGNVWIADSGAGDVVEYAHGGTTPIAALNTGGEPIGCSVDPTTGNLAVALYAGSCTRSGCTAGSVLVYANASGTPTSYADPSIVNYWPPGYDNAGNLFVETVLNGSAGYGLDELKANGANLTPVTLNFTISFAGGVMWDGKYLAVDDQSYQDEYLTALYQVTVSNFMATRVGTTVLTPSPAGCSNIDVMQPWIPKLGSGRTNPQAMKVIGANNFCVNAGFWNYPAGGSATKIITNDFNDPFGATVSRGAE